MSRERDEFDEIGGRKSIYKEAHENSYMAAGRSRQITAAAAAAGNLNTITPCAACKLLRRRCSQDCPFSPYFSPHEPHKFASVHKVFGASNVSKMLMEVPESQRADAANSLVYEANVRLRDPVYGCMGAISALQHQLHALQTELNTVRTHISKLNIIPPSSSNINIIPPLSSSPSSTSQQHHHHQDIPLLASGPPVPIASPRPQRLAAPNSVPLTTSSSSTSPIIYASSINYGGISSENSSYFG